MIENDEITTCRFFLMKVSSAFQSGGYIGKSITDAINTDYPDRGVWDLPNSPAWLDVITEKIPEFAGQAGNFANTLFWQLLIAKWR